MRKERYRDQPGFERTTQPVPACVGRGWWGATINPRPRPRIIASDVQDWRWVGNRLGTRRGGKLLGYEISLAIITLE